MGKTELAKALEEWFKESFQKSSNIYQDPIYLCLRENLSQSGNWRKAPRGDPSKGGIVKAMRETQEYVLLKTPLDKSYSYYTKVRK